MKVFAIYQPSAEGYILRELPWSPCTTALLQTLPGACGKQTRALLWDVKALSSQVLLAENKQGALRVWAAWARSRGLCNLQVTATRPKALEGAKELKCPYCGHMAIRECLA